MVEQAEIPEAEDPFGRRVAVTIAILAVLMALIANRGDDAKTEALLKTTEAANRWAYYQAKSIKEHAYDIQGQVLAIAPASPDATATARTDLIGRYAGQIERYKREKADIEAQARAMEAEARVALEVNNRCDQGVLFMQIAIVVCSVAILAQFALLWWGGMGVGIIGIIIGATSLWITADGAGPPPPAEAAAASAPATRTS